MKAAYLPQILLALGALCSMQLAHAAPIKSPKGKVPTKPTSQASKTGMKAANIDLPVRCYQGTPRQVKDTTADRPTDKLRAPIYLPRGAKVVSRGKGVTSSDDFPIIGELSYITDGNKEGTEGHWVELGPGTQWVQIDLGKPTKMYGVLLWHFHAESRVYRDVAVQVSDDADFVTGVTTLYNNDADNSSGMGIGKNKEFYDTFQGQWIAFPTVPKARYIRLYSRGNTSDPQNQYIEAEVWGDSNK